jgi:type IV secretory pathway VirB6-like protein
LNWNLFQTIFNGAITPIIAQMQAMIGPMCAAMQPVGLALISIWLVFAIWDLAAQTKTLMQVGKQLFTAALFYGLLWVGQYAQYVADLFLQTIPNTISAALGGNGTPIAQIDQLLAQTVQQASTVYEALPSYSLKAAMLSIGVIAFVIVAMICIAYLFIVMTVASLILITALVVGPVFIAAATTPFTRKFASGWLSVLVGGAVTQLLAVALIRLLVGASGVLLNQLTVTAQASNSNSIMMLYGLAQLGVLLWLFKEVTKKVPELAQTIGGGVYHSSSAAMAATFGTAAAAAGVAVATVTGAVGGAVGGATATGTASGAVLGGVSGAASGAARAAAWGFRYAAPAAASLSRGRR